MAGLGHIYFLIGYQASSLNSSSLARSRAKLDKAHPRNNQQRLQTQDISLNQLVNMNHTAGTMGAASKFLAMAGEVEFDQGAERYKRAWMARLSLPGLSYSWQTECSFRIPRYNCFAISILSFRKIMSPEPKVEGK